MLMRAFQNQSADLERGLGLLLLVFIFYGTTVEAAHGHGRTVPGLSSTATSLADKNGTLTPFGNKIGCNDCLICQLHQSFNTTLVTFRLADPPTQPRVKLTAAPPFYVLSQVTGPTVGRAPPSIS